MIYHASPTALVVFIAFVGFVLGLSFYLGRKAKSSEGYFAAHGQVGWFVNGIAFAGDYLSAASFLGICGMIAFFGYDGFLYSIGYLAGWIVALFVIAEPIKRLGKYTFADALDAKFNSRGIKIAAAISTLVVSVFYLIPQMVGAGTLIKPLLGLDHHWGVIMVGTVVILIVTTAGMVSTTWVQFIKGSLLVIFCTILTIGILNRGLAVDSKSGESLSQQVEVSKDGKHRWINNEPVPDGSAFGIVFPFGTIKALPGGLDKTGPLGPIEYISTIQNSTIATYVAKKTPELGPHGGDVTVYDQVPRKGTELLTAGGSTTFKGVRSPKLTDKLDFISLMLALFCGTASLPHILIRYYTVRDAAAARKSTVVGIAAIGFFYILTLFLGLGAMTAGSNDVTNNNMSAPLLAKSMSDLSFAIISAIAFTTVLGTVSGLILAASGAVAHDLMEEVFRHHPNPNAKVGAAKWTAVVIGIIAMVLGIVFQKLNVSFLVGWAFNLAASANLPSLVMLLFWKRTTAKGIIASISVGLVSSLAWVLLSAQCFKEVYGLDPLKAIAPFSQPAIITVPLAFVVLIVVSLFTKQRAVE